MLCNPTNRSETWFHGGEVISDIAETAIVEQEARKCA